MQVVTKKSGKRIMQITRLEKLPSAARNADFSFEIEGVVVPPFEAVPLQSEPVGLPRTKEYGLDETLFDTHDGYGCCLPVWRSLSWLATSV